MEIQKKRGWTQVEDLDGEKHWVESKYVSSRGSCVAVVAKSANLRVRPDSNAPRSELPFVEKYAAFRKVDRDGAWVKVQDEYKGTYWVHENLIWIPMIRSQLFF